jgi:valyl-tRNA synthetase
MTFYPSFSWSRAQVTNSLEAYNFGDAGRQIYEFLWDEYADWYIEVSKTRTKAGGDPLKVTKCTYTVYE